MYNLRLSGLFHFQLCTGFRPSYGVRIILPYVFIPVFYQLSALLDAHNNLTEAETRAEHAARSSAQEQTLRESCAALRVQLDAARLEYNSLKRISDERYSQWHEEREYYQVSLESNQCNGCPIVVSPCLILVRVNRLFVDFHKISKNGNCIINCNYFSIVNMGTESW